jgi:hypothetical protein
VRILLDECVDEELRYCFVDDDCQTCRYAGLRGLTNGQLLSAAERSGFDVVVTVDQNYQRSSSERPHHDS